jgi:uncharacterized protein (TIGR00369 family)
MSATDLAVPDGFKRFPATSGFIGVNGPLWIRHVVRESGDLVHVGFRVEARHTNPMGNCHGGMLATFCDMMLPLGIHRLSKEAANRFLPTINLQIDYLAPAPLGAWVQGDVQVLRTTRSLVFAQGLVTADGAAAVRVSGIFKIGQPFSSSGEAVL